MLDMKAIAQLLMKNPGAFPGQKGGQNSIMNLPVRGGQVGNFQTGWSPKGTPQGQLKSLGDILGR